MNEEIISFIELMDDDRSYKLDLGKDNFLSSFFVSGKAWKQLLEIYKKHKLT